MPTANKGGWGALYEVQEQKKREREERAGSASEPVIESEPVALSEPPVKAEPVAKTESVRDEAPAENRTGSKERGEPPRSEPVAKAEPVRKKRGAEILPDDAPHLRFPYEVLDKILCRLKPAPRVLLERLYRLSAGWYSDACIVSIPKLSRTCKMGETQVRRYLRELESDGYIERVEDDTTNPNIPDRGILFRVLLPRMAPPKNRTGVEFRTGSQSEPNKLKASKESSKKVDASLCPDCAGQGYFYPDGLDRGVKLCRHERL